MLSSKKAKTKIFSEKQVQDFLKKATGKAYSIEAIKRKYRPGDTKFNEELYNKVAQSDILKETKETIDARNKMDVRMSDIVAEKKGLTAKKPTPDQGLAIDRAIQKGDEVLKASGIDPTMKEVPSSEEFKRIERTMQNAVYSTTENSAGKIITTSKMTQAEKDAYMTVLTNRMMGTPDKEGVLFREVERSEPASPEELKTFRDELQEKLGVPVELENIEQVEGSVRAGATIVTENGVTKIKLDPRFANRDTVLEEEFHSIVNMMTDKVAMNRLLKLNGWDGKGRNDSWVSANEKLYEEYKRSDKTDGVWRRIKEFAEKISNFLRGKGYISQAEFFRKFANGEVEFVKGDRYKFGQEGESPRVLFQEYADLGKEFEDSPLYRETPSAFHKIKNMRFSNLSSYVINLGERLHKYAITPAFAAKFDPMIGRVRDIINSAIGIETPMGINRIMRDRNGWNQGTIFREGLTHTERMDMLNKIAKYSNDIYYGRQKPMTLEGYTKEDRVKYKDELLNTDKDLMRKIDSDMFAELYGEPKSEDRGEVRKQYEEFRSRMDKNPTFKNKVIDALVDKHRPEQGFIGKMGLNEGQAKVLRVMHKAMQDAQDFKRAKIKERLDKYRGDVVADLTDREFDSFFKGLDSSKFEYDTNPRFREIVKEVLDADPTLKEKILDTIAYRLVPKVDTFYFNSVRPTTPNTYIIRTVKFHDTKDAPGAKKYGVLDVLEKNAEGKKERKQRLGYYEERNDYANSLIEAKYILDDLTSKGFSEKTDGFFKIGDVLSRKEHFSKLTIQELQSLADSAYIAYDNEILNRLIDATKSGKFEAHTLKKDYVPGMKFTPEEYERQFERFIFEAIAGSTRGNALEAAKKEYANIEKEFNAPLTSSITSQMEKNRMIDTLKYLSGYINNAMYSDKARIDGFRTWVGATYTALKGSFLTQQVLQAPQTVMPFVMSEAKRFGMTGGNATRIFKDSYDVAWKVAKYEVAKKKGATPEELAKFGLDADFVNLY